jgi:hypothetical protein
MKYWYRLIIYFKTVILRKRSKYTLIDDIANCTFEDIKTRLKGMDFTIFNSSEQGYFVRFSDEFTEYIVSFTPQGKVNRIEMEYWKELDLKFYR